MKTEHLSFEINVQGYNVINKAVITAKQIKSPNQVIKKKRKKTKDRGQNYVINCRS